MFLNALLSASTLCIWGRHRVGVGVCVGYREGTEEIGESWGRPLRKLLSLRLT